jgi:bisphosphoglycerate-dependent phosphoglycerate mutase
MSSYAYVHCKPDGTPFYVGKGTVRRSKKLYGRNERHTRTVEKYGKDNILIGRMECSTDDTAFELERGIIKCLKRFGVDLANMTEGGLGGLQDQVPWNKGKKFTDEHRAKLSAARMGKSPWNKGNTFSAEAKAKMSESAKKRVQRNRNEKGQYV